MNYSATTPLFAGIDYDYSLSENLMISEIDGLRW